MNVRLCSLDVRIGNRAIARRVVLTPCSKSIGATNMFSPRCVLAAAAILSLTMIGSASALPVDNLSGVTKSSAAIQHVAWGWRGGWRGGWGGWRGGWGWRRRVGWGWGGGWGWHRPVAWGGWGWRRRVAWGGWGWRRPLYGFYGARVGWGGWGWRHGWGWRRPLYGFAGWRGGGWRGGGWGWRGGGWRGGWRR
jgi:hypothetical protein